MKVRETHASQSSSYTHEGTESSLLCHSSFSLYSHIWDPNSLTFSINCLLTLSPLYPPLLYDLAALGSSFPVLSVSFAPPDPLPIDPAPFPPLKKMVIVFSELWIKVDPKDTSVGASWHTVQIKSPGYLPIGISEQDVRETGFQHVQG